MDNNVTMLTHGYKQGVTDVDNGLVLWLEDNTASLALLVHMLPKLPCLTW